MAFTDLGSIASGGSTGNNQASLTVATTANCAAGELIVVVVTDDNISTGGGDTLETSGVVIGTAAPFALTKGRQNSTNLAAQAGASVSLWWGVLPYAIASGQNIVASFTNATLSDATALSARHFSFASLHNTVAVEATNATTATTTNPGSLTATTANIACLRIRATGCEYDSTQTITTTATWTTWAEGASAATGTITEQVIECEHLISTTTSAASAPTLGSACDSASVYVAFKEVANPFRLPILDVPRGRRRGRDFWIDAVGFVEAAAEPEILTADAGAYALTGSNVSFTLTLAASAGSYALTGSDVALTATTPDTTNLPAGGANWFNPWGRKRPVQDWLKGPIPAVPVTITADSGSYTLTGSAATWALGQAVGAGSYSITGSAAALALGHVAGAGSYSLSGTAASTVVAVNFAAAAGSYSSTGGSAVTFAFGQGAAAGSYTLTGADAGLVIPGAVTYLPAGMSGGYVPWRRPFPVNLRTITGRPLAPAPVVPVVLTAAGGSYVITGTAVSFVVATPADTTNLPAGATAWFNPWRRPYPVLLRTGISPATTAAAAPFTLTAGAGAYAITGTDAQLVQVGAITLTCGAGSYLLTGSDVSFLGVTPPTVEQPGGGYTGGVSRGRMIRKYSRKRLRDECEELLEYLQGLPPLQAQEVCQTLPLERLSLLELLPLPLPHGIVIPQGPLRPPQIEEDEDEIALLLELLS